MFGKDVCRLVWWNYGRMLNVSQGVTTWDTCSMYWFMLQSESGATILRTSWLLSLDPLLVFGLITTRLSLPASRG